MNSQTKQLPPRHRAILERFVLACQADEGVVAAFLSGSYARGKADAYSDLDLGLLTTDAAYEDFGTRQGAFIRQLGEPLFLEDFDIPNMVFFIFENGVEGELAFAPESQLDQLHSGPSSVLLDKRGLFPGAMFTPHTSPSAGQIETLRRQVF
jgi:predicted nucleotidyltransferase